MSEPGLPEGRAPAGGAKRRNRVPPARETQYRSRQGSNPHGGASWLRSQEPGARQRGRPSPYSGDFRSETMGFLTRLRSGEGLQRAVRAADHTVAGNPTDRGLEISANAFTACRWPPDRRSGLACHAGTGEPTCPPLLIIAGAGSVKTNTLAHRVAHLAMNGTDPNRILLHLPLVRQA
jgi:hypothetical protein